MREGLCKVRRVLNQVGNKRIPKRLEITSNVSPLDRVKPSQKPSLDSTECSGGVEPSSKYPTDSTESHLTEFVRHFMPTWSSFLGRVGFFFAGLTYFWPFPLSLVRFTIQPSLYPTFLILHVQILQNTSICHYFPS